MELIYSLRLPPNSLNPPSACLHSLLFFFIRLLLRIYTITREDFMIHHHPALSLSPAHSLAPLVGNKLQYDKYTRPLSLAVVCVFFNVGHE